MSNIVKKEYHNLNFEDWYNSGLTVGDYYFYSVHFMNGEKYLEEYKYLYNKDNTKDGEVVERVERLKKSEYDKIISFCENEINKLIKICSQISKDQFKKVYNTHKEKDWFYKDELRILKSLFEDEVIETDKTKAIWIKWDLKSPKFETTREIFKSKVRLYIIRNHKLNHYYHSSTFIYEFLIKARIKEYKDFVLEILFYICVMGLYDYYNYLKEFSQSNLKIKDSLNFGYMYQPSTLKVLFDELIKEDFINQGMTFIQFKKVLTENFNSHDERIIWDCENTQIRFIINHIQKDFKNFRLSVIGESKKFINKQGKVLNQRDLSRAGTHLKSTNVKQETLLNKILAIYSQSK